MTAIILDWNPDHRNDWNYAEARRHVAASGLWFQPWSVNRALAGGTDVWLFLRNGHGRGLVGHGVVVQTGPLPSLEQGTAPEQKRMLLHVAFDSLLPPGEQIGVELLRNALPTIDWDVEGDPELDVDPAGEASIRSLWRDFGPPPGPDPVLPAPGIYPREALTRVEVNRYEQDTDARRACIAHHGTTCAACGFSFEQKYGEIGVDFIPVHHLVPVAQLGGTYELDPITDLVPLCANCHAMVHQGVTTPRTVAELRRIIDDAGFLRGAIVTAEQLEAQRQARELLGP